MISNRGILFVAAIACLACSFDAHAAGNPERGKALYMTLCSSCHGDTGAGDGPIALTLPPDQKPRNLQKDPFKFATDDTKFLELLRKGGIGVGLNPLMPAQTAAHDDELDDIIAYVHTLRK